MRFFNGHYLDPSQELPQTVQPYTNVNPAAYPDAGSLQRSKFVGRNRNTTAELQKAVFLPPDIRRAAQMLGVAPNEITTERVYQAWKHLMSQPGAHPDSGGHTEGAILLNTSRDVLLQWIKESAPKLGRQFPSQR